MPINGPNFIQPKLAPDILTATGGMDGDSGLEKQIKQFLRKLIPGNSIKVELEKVKNEQNPIFRIRLSGSVRSYYQKQMASRSVANAFASNSETGKSELNPGNLDLVMLDGKPLVINEIEVDK